MVESEPGREHARSVIRTVVVVLVSSWAIVSSVPDIALPWHPFSSYGFYADTDGRIADVYPGYSAAQAGLSVGDRIDLAATPVESRRHVLLAYSAAFNPGERATFAIKHDGRSRTVTLTSKLFARSAADNISDIALILSQVLFALIGAALVLLRPSVMTWSFFAYTISVVGGGLLSESALGGTAFLVQFALLELASAAGPPAFVLFALRFPRDRTTGLGRAVERALPVLFLVNASLNVYQQVAPVLWARPTASLSQPLVFIQLACYIIAVIAFVATYQASVSDDRPRIRWVMLSLGIAFASQLWLYVSYQTSLISWTHPIWVLNLLQIPVILPGLAVAYAVIRHRVIDVRFVVSRALVYATLTTILIAVFALIDWVLGQMLAQTRLALAAEIAAALAAGFSLDALHRTVDRIVDRVLFRRRYLAERHLHRVAASLPHAKSEKVVGEILVDEMTHSFDLTSAALFRRTEDGVFERQASSGWPDASVWRLDLDDPIVLQVHGDFSPMRIGEQRWRRDDLPLDRARPILAVPVVVRHSLAAIAFYGPHRSGEDLDPDEVKSIVEVSVGAGAAYDHIDAQAYRRENERLSREIEHLRRQLAAVTT